MEKLKCIIVDDDEMSRIALIKLCNKVENIDVVAVCESGTEVFKVLRENPVDVLFLDIEMPDISGIEVVKNLEEVPQIIFTTSKKEYALESYEVQATDYLTKPLNLARFIKAIERARKVVESKSSTALTDDLFIRSEGRIVRIAVDDIIYIETLGDYVTFRTSKEKFIVHSTLKNIDKKLKSEKFLKVHRSFIVNLSKIVDIEETNMVVAENPNPKNSEVVKIIPISRAHKPVLMNKIRVVS